MTGGGRRRSAFPTVGGVLLALGAAILSAGAIAPQSVESAWGHIRAVAVATPQALTGVLPEVSLGRPGTAEDLDACDGTFTKMIEYNNPDAPPVWAAHNSCGGDAILPWGEGQQFLIDGDRYVVLEVRHLPKFTSTSDDLAGLQGDIALQTCLYGKPLIAFIGAQRMPNDS